MQHFIYKTTHISGKYYIGRHSTENINDGYLGSGRWVKSIKDKSNLSREILEYCDDDKELIEKETLLIEQNISNPLCMNWNDKGVGWSSRFNPSKLNPSRFAGDKNPMKNEKVRKKASDSIKKGYAEGRIHPLLGKNHSQETIDKIKKSKKGQRPSEKAIQKSWKIITPEGEEVIITNLRQYSLEKGLDPGNMMHVARGRQKQHKGYKVSKLS